MSGAPPLTEQIEGCGRERGETVLMSLALPDAQEHARRVDVLDAEAADLAETNAGRIEDGEQHAITQRADGCQKRDQFVDGKNDWKMPLPPAIRDAHDQVGTIHHVEIEEAESRHID